MDPSYNSNGNSSVFSVDIANNMTHKMRKMTIQDEGVCESIITMPKTPYIR